MVAVVAKAALVLTPVAVGLLGLLGGSKKGGSRPPFDQPIAVPGQDIPFENVDAALCLCWQAGEHQRTGLASCVLARLWPDVPWPARRG